MIDKVRKYIKQEIGLEADAMVLVALSGGADSTALLLIMKELGYKLHALHCNFHLRGEESNRDQVFVEELCRKYDVPLSVRHFQTAEVAKERGISIEMAARELRYDWFKTLSNSPLKGENIIPLPLREGRGGSFIAVAHHRDDQAETLLLNLLRGTGLRGLAGMSPNHDGIIRPLLCLSREEILQYLESKGQTYVTDSTNSERIAQRNRLRIDVMPLLRSINPSAIEHLCLACDNVRQSLPYYKKGIEAAFKEQGITADTFPIIKNSSQSSGAGGAKFKIQNYNQTKRLSTLLHEWLAGKGFNATQEEEMLREDPPAPFRGRNSGKMWHSATHTVLRDRKAFLLLPLKGDGGSLPQLKEEIVPCIEETGPDIAYFDADLLTEPIEVRPVREGDAFVPFGMKGRKLVSDFLTDRKVNRLQKAETFVATCGNDIIWLIGYRSDNRFRVTDKTRRILKLTMKK
jgi:tRNA(Ile)-lysidine synthase